MKLFVWYNPIDIAYGGSVLYVMAKDIFEARRKAALCEVWKYGMTNAGVLGAKGAEKLGDPDCVFDGRFDNTSGAVYSWSE